MWIEPTSYSATVLGTTDLDRVSQTFHERSVVKRLAQEADRSVIDHSLCATTLNLIEVKIRSLNVRFGS